MNANYYIFILKNNQLPTIKISKIPWKNISFQPDNNL